MAEKNSFKKLQDSQVATETRAEGSLNLLVFKVSKVFQGICKMEHFSEKNREQFLKTVDINSFNRLVTTVL